MKLWDIMECKVLSAGLSVLVFGLKENDTP